MTLKKIHKSKSKELREQFNITGLFYKNGGFSFRKYLNIKLKTSSKTIPDLMLVMMNPGSSKPLNEKDNFNKETPTIPDNTQDQIMQVMLQCGFEYARILNLSDKRESKSGEFYKNIDTLDKKGIAHSIFDDRRIDDFEDLFVKDIPVIFAWGVSSKLRGLARQAVERIGNENIFGIKKVDYDWAYYHPLPRIYKDRIKWVDDIVEMINKK